MTDKIGRQDQSDGAVKERVQDKTQEPTLFNVVLLNDDYTPMPFVVEVLENLDHERHRRVIVVQQHDVEERRLLGLVLNSLLDGAIRLILATDLVGHSLTLPQRTGAILNLVIWSVGHL